MHSLKFDLHLAILDPVIGVGMLVLPKLAVDTFLYDSSGSVLD